jgi:hypothetical protein
MRCIQHRRYIRNSGEERSDSHSRPMSFSTHELKPPARKHRPTPGLEVVLVLLGGFNLGVFEGESFYYTETV